ncbi:hypothetical protein [Kutzneria sp. NPDC052558]|uniref:hypothetical protein n=1 Tax=Kutzneria sp. NPDC052558 TaxID=3364121 RepID=UPI0037C74061
MEVSTHVCAADLRAGAPPARALELAPLLGVWHATDRRNPGVVRLELGRRGNTLVVRAFGADSPEPIDWGETTAVGYGASVAAGEAMAFTAGYDFGFLTVTLAAYAKQGILVLDTFTVFTDDSGRADYFTREFFHR